ncbi:MAG: hypothetical protein R3C19_01915 [Planctomycetaceae bacterium]
MPRPSYSPTDSGYRCLCSENYSDVRSAVTSGWSRFVFYSWGYLKLVIGLRPYECPHCFTVYYRPIGLIRMLLCPYDSLTGKRKGRRRGKGDSDS